MFSQSEQAESRGEKKQFKAQMIVGVALLLLVGVYASGQMNSPKMNDAATNMKVMQAAADSDWVLIMRQTTSAGFFPHSVGSTGLLNENNPSAPNYCNLPALANYASNGVYELKLVWPNSGLSDQIWKQTSNPWLTKSSGVTGYQPVSVPYTGGHWGGLEWDNANTILDGAHFLNHWWYAVGSFGPFNGGIPGPDPHVVHAVELYAKVPAGSGSNSGSGIVKGSMTYNDAVATMNAGGCPGIQQIQSATQNGVIMGTGCDYDANEITLAGFALGAYFTMYKFTIQKSDNSISCHHYINYGVKAYEPLFQQAIGGCTAAELKTLKMGQAQAFPSQTDLRNAVEGGSCPQQLLISNTAQTAKYGLAQTGTCGVDVSGLLGAWVVFYRPYPDGKVYQFTVYTDSAGPRLLRIEPYIQGLRHPRSDLGRGTTWNLRHFVPSLQKDFHFTVDGASFELVPF